MKRQEFKPKEKLDQIRGSVKSGRAKLEEIAQSLKNQVYSNKNDDDL